MLQNAAAAGFIGAAQHDGIIQRDRARLHLAHEADEDAQFDDAGGGEDLIGVVVDGFVGL